MRRLIGFSWLILIIGFLVFSSSLFNGFSFDDIRWIAYNKVYHISNLLFFFTSGMQAPLDHANYFTFYYRPIPFALFLLIREGTAFVFHLFQLTVFLASVLLVYKFFKKFFTPLVSFFLALIFLVHPINQTLGAYISVTQDTLCFFGGMLALFFISSHLKFVKKIFLTSTFFLFSLFSKEFGLLFLPLILLFVKFFSKNRIILIVLPLAAATFIYIFLRNIAFEHPYITYLSANPVGSSFGAGLTLVPILLFYFLVEIFMPGASVPRIKTILIQHPPFVLIIGLLVMGIFSIFAYAYFLKRHKPDFLKPYLFFISWFILGFLPYLQIIPLDALIARWWLSFSLFGALGVLGVIWSATPIVSKRYIPIFYALFLAYILALTLGTIRANLSLGEWWLHLSPP